MKAVAVEGSWSPDGKRIAYRPYIMAYTGPSGWRQHRGGDTPPIWIIDANGKTLEKIPHENASDSNPLWIGENVAFISDRNDGAANLFLYDAHTHAVRQLTHETPWDVRNAGAYGDTVVYEAGGELKSLNVGTGEIRPIPIHLAVQSNQARPQWKDAGKNVTSAWLSPYRQARADYRTRRRVQRAGQGRFGAQPDRHLGCARVRCAVEQGRPARRLYER